MLNIDEIKQKTLQQLKDNHRKSISDDRLCEMLVKKYKENPTDELKTLIINSQLKDLLHLSVNYKSSHQDVDLQDLVQISSLGLLDALENYKIDANINFQDYGPFCSKVCG